MTRSVGGLGRGLEALIPRSQPESARAEGPRLEQVALDQIRPNRAQPRREFDQGAIEDLAASIREVGVLQPVVLRSSPPGFELVMGERRWRAAALAGLRTIPAVVRHTEDADLLRDALLENVHREQLNPLEEAAAYSQLLTHYGVTHDQLATRLGRSRPSISNTIRLLQLSPRVQRRVAAGVLSAGHARALLAVAAPERQTELADRVVAEGISVRGLEELLSREPAQPERRQRASKPEPTEYQALAERLRDHLDTPVTIESSRRRGRVIIEFSDVADLERIVSAAGVVGE